MVFDLIIETNEKERPNRPEFNPARCFNLEAPVLVVICYDWTACVAYNENGGKVCSDQSPKEGVEAKSNLPTKSEVNWQPNPKNKMKKNEMNKQTDARLRRGGELPRVMALAPDARAEPYQRSISHC